MEGDADDAGGAGEVGDAGEAGATAADGACGATGAPAAGPGTGAATGSGSPAAGDGTGGSGELMSEAPPGPSGRFRVEQAARGRAAHGLGDGARSEEHTSELQSLAYLVCRLLLEKKKTDTTT